LLNKSFTIELYWLVILNFWSGLETKKNARRDANTVLAIVMQSQKFLPHGRPPSRGHRMAKI